METKSKDAGRKKSPDPALAAFAEALFLLCEQLADRGVNVDRNALSLALTKSGVTEAEAASTPEELARALSLTVLGRLVGHAESPVATERKRMKSALDAHRKVVDIKASLRATKRSHE